MKRFLIPLVLLSLVGCGRSLSNGPKVDDQHVDEIRVSLVGAGGPATAGGSGAASGPEPTGWATFKGKFTLAGEAPPRQPLKVDKETDVCAPGGRPVYSEELVVDSSGGIKDVVIYVTSKLPEDEPWTHPSMKPGTLTEPVIFDQKECIFLTHMVAMRTSQPLQILNSDPIGHNTNLSPGKNSGFNQIIPAGGKMNYQPTSEENAPFSAVCSIHPWMGSYILIRNNGYFAVTAPDGTFEIPNLPAGVELEFRVWQEKTKFVQSVSVDGAAESWSKGKFIRTLNEGDNQISVTVNL